MELAYSILTTMIHNGCRALKDKFLETGKSFQQRDKDNFVQKFGLLIQLDFSCQRGYVKRKICLIFQFWVLKAPSK